MSTEINKEKFRQEFNKILGELRKWPEDKVKKILQGKLEQQGWTITEISWGREKGKDLEAIKGSDIITIEAKGEPRSPSSYRQQRFGYIRDALASIVVYMVEDNPHRRYCIAFPRNESYPHSVPSKIPLLVRKKLGLNVLFVDEDGSISILLPDAVEPSKLQLFDDIFNAT